MHKSHIGAALVTLPIAAIAYAATPETHWARQSTVTVTVYEDIEGSAKRKVIVDSTIAIVPGRPFEFVSGGVLGDTELKVGTEISGKVVPADDGSAQIDMRISATESVRQQNDPVTKLTRTVVFDLDTIATSGKAVRLDCSNSQWCELTIDQ